MQEELRYCTHAQGPLGYSSQDVRTFLRERFARTLSRTEVIPDKRFKNDKFSVNELSHTNVKSLWRQDPITHVLGREMEYPGGEGQNLYSLLNDGQRRIRSQEDFFQF